MGEFGPENFLARCLGGEEAERRSAEGAQQCPTPHIILHVRADRGMVARSGHRQTLVAKPHKTPRASGS